MDEDFELPVVHMGHEYIFNARLLVFGFTHKIQVNLNGQMVTYEPDEERNYRAILSYDEIADPKNIDTALLKSIAEVIEKIVK